MSFDKRLLHSLAIVRDDADSDDVDNLDGMGYPIPGVETVRLIRGLVQPRTAREIADAAQAGVGVSSHVIYMRPVDIVGADYVRFEPADGRRYNIVGSRDAAGIGHHLEVDAELVQATPDADGS